MKFLDKLRSIKKVVKNQLNYIKICENRSRDVADLIRQTHSMEKGLCISDPRLGFGHEKQENMLRLLNKLKDDTDEYTAEARNMAVMSLRQYVTYHDKLGYSDEMIERIRKFIAEWPDIPEGYGGTKVIYKREQTFNVKEIEDFFNSRHSIREFEKTPINEENLRKALVLAQRAPSACNRQAYRVYVLNHEQSLEYAKVLSGIGGFADDVERFIMITGKLSAYAENEIDQYIVSASMYASYLTLTLHLYGIGACVVQRSVIYTEEWNDLRIKYKIPEDEQIICLLAIGNIKDECIVPKSYRMNENTMFKFF